MSCQHVNLCDIQSLLYVILASINSDNASRTAVISTINDIDTNVNTILSLLQPGYSSLMNHEHVIPAGIITNYTLIPIAVNPTLIPLNTTLPVYVFGAGGTPQPGTFTVTRTSDNTYTINASSIVPLQSALSFY